MCIGYSNTVSNVDRDHFFGCYAVLKKGNSDGSKSDGSFISLSTQTLMSTTEVCQSTKNGVRKIISYDNFYKNY